MPQDCLLKSAVSHCKVAFASFLQGSKIIRNVCLLRKANLPQEAFFPCSGSHDWLVVPYQD